ncbi:glycosylase [Singulisphaera sp. PoT]|uniref:glycosylase n=1 Tax=Singulisphaera sp. PoT TaxID=3411797 RepID=UPI003BF52BC7
MRFRHFAGSALLLIGSAFNGAGVSLADEFPKDLVAWSPLADKPVFDGTGGSSWDRKIRERGYILMKDGTYHLWYTGYNDDLSPTRFLGHATSADGIHWDRDPANPIFSKDWVEDVCVIPKDGEYIMFAEGKNDIAHQLTSRDGVKWDDLGSLDIRKVDGTPISKGSYGTPAVWFEDGTWYLYYERGDQGVWLATSKDRKVWTNVQDTPVLAMGPEAYDKTAVAINQIFKRDGVYYALYHANANRPWKDWTTNIARSKDLVHWEKYPGNPIIQNNCSSAVLVPTPKGNRLYTMHPNVKVFANPTASIDKK